MDYDVPPEHEYNDETQDSAVVARQSTFPADFTIFTQGFILQMKQITAER